MKTKCTVLLMFLSLTVASSAFASDISLNCEVAGVLKTQLTYALTQSDFVLKKVSTSMSDDGRTEKMLSATQIAAENVRPGVAELGDLFDSAMVEFVVESKDVTAFGHKMMESQGANQMSFVAMISGEDEEPLQNFALVLGKSQEDGSREGRLLSLNCEKTKSK